MNKNNKNISFKGKPVTVKGKQLSEGDALPDFKLTADGMTDLTREDIGNKVFLIASVPSLDTSVCSLEARRFNEEAENLPDDVVVLIASRDLPFAQKRWCEEHHCRRVVTGSDYKHRSFGENFGVDLPDLGLLARAVFVADKHGTITHVEYVREITEEPDYRAALEAAKSVAAQGGEAQ